MCGGTPASIRAAVVWGAVLLHAVGGAATAHAQAPTLRVQSVRLRTNGARAADDTRAALCGIVGAPAAFESGLADGRIEIEVIDAAHFAVSGRVSTCRPAPGRRALHCRSGDRNLRVVVSQFGTGRVRLCAFLRRRDGDAAARPQGPVTVTLRQLGGGDRSDVLSDCQPSEPLGLTCQRHSPNIVVIVTDDQRWDTMEYMPRTLELLAQDGVSFTNSYVSSPVCSPSRATLFTGQYAHRHRVRTNLAPDGGAPGFVGADASTLATWLHGAGYRTGMYGKYMNFYTVQCPPYTGSCYVPPGWDEWHVFLTQKYYDYKLAENGVVTSYGSDPADYSTDVLAAKAVEFIRAAHGRPFYLHLGLQAPHQEGGSLPVPAPRHEGIFEGLEWPHPISYYEPDVSDKPPWIQSLPHADDQLGETILTYGVWGDLVQQFGLEALQAADEAVAAVMAAVQASGQADNTVVVFTSDNGYFDGEHRIYLGKNYPYEEALRVPLIIHFPALIRAARSDTHMVVNLDLAPTLAELAEVTPPSTVDGRSLVPLLNGDATSWRSAFLLELWNPAPDPLLTLPSYFGVRSERFAYVLYPDARREELYDLSADPFELDNRAADPAAASTLDAMRLELYDFVQGQ